MTTKTTVAGFIATDDEQLAIYGIGATEEEAVADARKESCEPAADFPCYAATVRLLAAVEKSGGAPDVRWHLIGRGPLAVADIDAPAETTVARCGSGLWTGEQCESTCAAVVIEHMPAHLRASHIAAGNSGRWPANGAVRVACCRACADAAIADDPDWTTIVENASPAEYERDE